MLRIVAGLVVAMVAAWMAWRGLAPRPRLPRGLTDVARFRTELGLDALAHALHAAIRADVLTQVEHKAQVLVVSCGVALPPGPVRLILEERSRGIPGARYVALLRRRAGVRGAMELELRGGPRWAFARRRRRAERVVEAVALGLSVVDGVSDIAWIDGRKRA